MKTQDAIDWFGGARALADALGITAAAVYQWGETVPELRAFQIERLTDGDLMRELGSGAAGGVAPGETLS